MKQQIYSTKDYKAFKFIQGNREIIKGHFLRLTAAISKKNLLNRFPILVNKDFEIIDGQHRFLVAKNNDLELFYTVEDDASLDETLVINTNQRQWSLEDFINSYIKRGYKEYIKLEKFRKETGFSIQMIMTILTKEARHGRGLQGMRHAIRDGSFKTDNWGYAEEFVKKLEDLRPYYVLKNLERQREFLFALNKTISLVNWDKFLEKLEQVQPRLEMQVSYKNYLRQFEDIYNWRDRWGGKSFEGKRPIEQPQAAA